MHATGNSDNPKVIISVLNWNGGQRVVDFVQSLDRIDYPHVEIVVVDNASADGSADRIRAAHPALRLIETNENLGYAGGHRRALDYALSTDADLFWILNYDLTFEPDVLRTLVHAYRCHGPALYGSLTLRQFGADQPWVVERDFHRFKAPGVVDFEHPVIACRQDPSTLDTTGNPVRPIATLNGNSLLIPLSIVRRHGFMHDAFFMYGEEWDYCFQLAREGVASRLVLPSVVYHEFQGSTRHSEALSALMTYYGIRNELVITRRYGDWRYFVTLVTRHLRRLLFDVRRWLHAQFTARRFTRPPVLMRFFVLGMVDGLFGRLGKRFAPEAYVEGESPGR